MRHFEGQSREKYFQRAASHNATFEQQKNKKDGSIFNRKTAPKTPCMLLSLLALVDPSAVERGKIGENIVRLEERPLVCCLSVTQSHDGLAEMLQL